ncbi:GntR family transcriptional regulator [Luteibacter rhizovicinus]|uniref:GntR family transcriptional regulator n=1 Tax=Luteibacter rhizovicinus TaxID=242606 RepID=A0A4R3YPK5_9GAMM|nr:FadR/GntR family transcriptional regulator [Luteibacter rhizovicinus]TCV94687.1 GntR family transcriptional regulator [Luteibacter rhizovicinus]
MVKPIAVRSLHNQVIQELGRLIVSGELEAGKGLPREELLAERMNVSRTALREAMKVLSAKGLIESRQKTGTRVREAIYWNQLDADVLAWRCASMPTESFVEKLVEMREIIEPAAAAAAARRRTPEQLAVIKAAYDAMDASETLDAWAEADLAFHESMLQATNNELMTSLFSVIETALGTYFVLSASNSANFKLALPQHLKVYEAIRRRQPEVARQAMVKMVDDSRNNIRRHQANNKQASNKASAS